LETEYRKEEREKFHSELLLRLGKGMGKCGEDGIVGQGRDMKMTRGTIQRYTWCWPLRGCCETSPSMGCMGARETGRSRVERARVMPTYGTKDTCN